MDSALIDETSEVFLGKWKRLVSTTNWEKGRIIGEWRQSLVESGAAAAEYSDEAWSQRVGNITPQHVGRLRRVWDRFAAERESYEGLFWSHFQAAADWDDAEMWLEGAVQNEWSISQMRRQRYETLGGLETPPTEGAAADLADWDEDAGAPDDSADGGEETARAADEPHTGSGRASRGDTDDDAQDEDAGTGHSDERARSADAVDLAEPIIRPFAHLPTLPDDVAEAFEAFKLCILRHKLAGWEEISRGGLLATLDALKEFAAVPASE